MDVHCACAYPKFVWKLLDTRSSCKHGFAATVVSKRASLKVDEPGNLSFALGKGNGADYIEGMIPAYIAAGCDPKAAQSETGRRAWCHQNDRAQQERSSRAFGRS